ncbi:hypothetical protein BCIN_10g01620 [Botrytis cinerea B05.10]|uniref:Zn(2)-C6 fungal-type domain-containing protein n=1 Tax=Botryotinia fuckeliana (strain B05.10) TaxID=332648 RepID=A0A384JUF3_BOTFB|nr:hypothetical protein BCIN_10g01620 [Botrytis cinerea B05.10]ATZ54142.1 hypothetical protein BCIN_10g01620 [Botrytis cinerea B05.10]
MGRRHGKLSKGCQTCRKRKIKCDEVMPACNQCQKAGWKCPQYGDSLERMFQYSDVRDLERSIHNEPPRSKKRTSCIISVPLTFKAQLPSVLLSKEISNTINDRAIDFFFSTHIFRDCGPVKGYYEYLFHYRNDPNINHTLYTTITAVSLAAYAYAFKYSYLLKKATQSFGHALRLVNTALSSIEEATKDYTIISVVLFNTFGVLTCQSLDTLIDCDRHISGATSMIKLRGTRQMETRHGLQLFLQMNSILLQSCIWHSFRVPEDLIKLQKHAANFLDADDPAWKLNRLIVELTTFRADIKDGILHERSSIIRAAIELDIKFSSLASEMSRSPQWHYDSIPIVSTSSTIFGTYYQVYSDLWVTQIWNHLRTCRLFIYEEIGKQYTSREGKLIYPIVSMDYHLWFTTLQQTIDDVCASLPQYFNDVSEVRTSSGISGSPNPNFISSSFSTNVVPHIAGTYFLLWPLLNSGRMTFSNLQRDWIIGRCRVLGDKTGIQQMFTLADVLEKREMFPVYESCLAKSI